MDKLNELAREMARDIGESNIFICKKCGHTEKNSRGGCRECHKKYNHQWMENCKYPKRYTFEGEEYEEAGEVRPPLYREIYLHLCGDVRCCFHNKAQRAVHNMVGRYPILRPVKSVVRKDELVNPCIQCKALHVCMEDCPQKLRYSLAVKDKEIAALKRENHNLRRWRGRVYRKLSGYAESLGLKLDISNVDWKETL